jgi:hypothetical protein
VEGDAESVIELIWHTAAKVSTLALKLCRGEVKGRFKLLP